MEGNYPDLNATDLLIKAIEDIEPSDTDRVLVITMNREGNIIKAIHNSRSHAEYVGLLQISYENLGAMDVTYVSDEEEE